ncbi:ABC-three component system protein [Aeromonas salmonicida]
MSDKNIFDATASALGYIYQVRYALLLALKKLTITENPDNCYISIEVIDDIAFEKDGTPFELLQAKYHGSTGNIGNRSSDLWKTIRVWCELITKSDLYLEDTTFTLLTTENAKNNTIAEYLGTSNKRNTEKALTEMLTIASEKNNTTNQKAYDAFNFLESWQQHSLLSSIYIIHNAPDILNVEKQIQQHIRMSTSQQHVSAFTTRLEGIWFKRAIEIMSSKDEKSINLGEIVNIVDELRPQFMPGNLPADYENALPDKIDVQNDDRIFIEQLRLIGANNSLIKNAIINYYRAFEQRSRWSRDNLVKPGELKKYIDRLRDEWDHQKSLLDFDYDLSNGDQKIEAGKTLYKLCQTSSAISIRPEYNSAYVARGTYHTMSDDKVIGWHTDYIELLAGDSSQDVA